MSADHQEGTHIEPTYEEGFKWLLALQQRIKGSTDEDAMERRVREYNQLKADTWGRCDNVPMADRIDCGGSSKEQCEGELGCCWRETSVPGRPYCFQKATEPITDCADASVRDCELRPLDRLCLCKHAQPPPPPTPPPPPLPPTPRHPQPPPPPATVSTGTTTTTSRVQMPWWIVLISGLAGIGASSLVCVAAYFCMTQNERERRSHRVLREDA